MVESTFEVDWCISWDSKVNFSPFSISYWNPHTVWIFTVLVGSGQYTRVERTWQQVRTRNWRRYQCINQELRFTNIFFLSSILSDIGNCFIKLTSKIINGTLMSKPIKVLPNDYYKFEIQIISQYNIKTKEKDFTLTFD